MEEQLGVPDDGITKSMTSDTKKLLSFLEPMFFSVEGGQTCEIFSVNLNH